MLFTINIYTYIYMVTYDPIKHIILFEEEPKRTRFRLDKIELLVCNSQMIDIDLSRQNDSCDGDTLCQFSLLIGVNGVGKTTILRSIVDFFIDFHEYYNHDGYRITTRKNIQVVGVKYQANGNTYHVYKNENEKKFYVNDSDILNQKIPIPNIVASCFSVFDKFPIKIRCLIYQQVGIMSLFILMWEQGRQIILFPLVLLFSTCCIIC